MSYQVFARKYRPRTFEDVLGQDHVVQTLRNAIDQDRLAHAYLFVGPRGTGKTSTARIFAKALNCSDGPKIKFDPDEDICIEIAEGRSLDVLEIDGASNNGVEQVRELRETVSYAPARGRFKIYYIDEVHMLTSQAFNALLKTLEEPPEHVKFIFATTEPNKILATILSRCQRFDLRPIPTEVIAGHLQKVASNENVTLEKPAAWAIAKGADGGMRDALSMLDQLVAFCGDAINESNVQEIFGFTASETVAALVTAILGKDVPTAIRIVQSESELGKDLSQLLGEVTGLLRALLIARIDPEAPSEGLTTDLWKEVRETTSGISDDRLLTVLDNLADADARMRRAPNKQLHFEIALIRAVQSLDEIRLSDVIKTLERAPETAPAAAPPPATTPEPPRSASPPKSAGRRRGKEPSLEERMQNLIEKAPERDPERPPAEEAPGNSPARKEEPQGKPPQETTGGNNFHQDPLIEDALRMFEGKLKD